MKDSSAKKGEFANMVPCFYCDAKLKKVCSDVLKIDLFLFVDANRRKVLESPKTLLFYTKDLSFIVLKVPSTK